MSPWTVGILVVIAIVIFWFVGSFNKFKRLRILIDEAWSGIDVQLKRKSNIILNLLDVLKMQMSFEKDLLLELANTRKILGSDDHEKAMAANDRIDQIVTAIRATEEAYPTLGSNDSFKHLMVDIRDCEDKVSYARNRYNMNVAKFNMEIAVFPGNIISGMMGYSPEKMFELTTPPREIADNLRIGKI